MSIGHPPTIFLKYIAELYYQFAKLGAGAFSAIAAGSIVLAAQVWSYPYPRSIFIELAYLGAQAAFMVGMLSLIELTLMAFFRTEAATLRIKAVIVVFIGLIALSVIAKALTISTPLLECALPHSQICVSQNINDFPLRQLSPIEKADMPP